MTKQKGVHFSPGQGIAKAIFVPPWDSPAGGVLGTMMSSQVVSGVWGLAFWSAATYFSVQPDLLPIRQPPRPYMTCQRPCRVGSKSS